MHIQKKWQQNLEIFVGDLSLKRCQVEDFASKRQAANITFSSRNPFFVASFLFGDINLLPRHLLPSPYIKYDSKKIIISQLLLHPWMHLCLIGRFILRRKKNTKTDCYKWLFSASSFCRLFQFCALKQGRCSGRSIFRSTNLISPHFCPWQKM